MKQQIILRLGNLPESRETGIISRKTQKTDRKLKHRTFGTAIEWVSKSKQAMALKNIQRICNGELPGSEKSFKTLQDEIKDVSLARKIIAKIDYYNGLLGHYFDTALLLCPTTQFGHMHQFVFLVCV